MACTGDPTRPDSDVWGLVAEQHGVVSRRQLVARGYGRSAIDHRLAVGRLYRVTRGVYAVGRPDLTRAGVMMAAVLACGEGAAISHETAAELWRLRRAEHAPIEVSMTRRSPIRRAGLRVHRRREFQAADRDRIPVTTVAQTLVDMAGRWSERHLEAAVNQADAHDLMDPDALREALDGFAGQSGVRRLRALLDEKTFRLTDSELERRFLAIVRKAGLALPETRRYANSWRVDFIWPDLGLVVETDSLRYHRTPSQQNRDYERDHAHRLAGRPPLRFTHHQIRYKPDHVVRLLRNELP